MEAGLEIDGIIGNKSIDVINHANPKTLFNSYKDARINFYLNLIDRKPELEVFKKGWLNRINSFVYK